MRVVTQGINDCNRKWVAASPSDSGPENSTLIEMLEVITLFYFADASWDLVFVDAGHICYCSTPTLGRTSAKPIKISSFCHFIY